MSLVPRIRADDPTRPILVNGVIDATGTGLYLAVSTVFLLSVLHLRPAEIGLGLSIAGAAGFVGTMPVAALADRFGPRRTAVALNLVRVVAFTGLALSQSFATFLVAAAVVAVTTGAFPPVHQALIGALVPAADRTATMAKVRAIKNVGFALGGVLAALLLLADSDVALRIALIVNALTFGVGAVLLGRLPVEHATVSHDGRSKAALRDPTYMTLTVVNSVFSSNKVLLDVGIPLWVLKATEAPRVVIACVMIINTVLVVALQVRLTRDVDGVPAATTSIRRAGLWFGAAMVVIGFAGTGGAVLATAAMLIGATLLTVGEMLESAGWWTVSYDLAPDGRKGEYLGTFALGAALPTVLGPVLSAVLVSVGPGAWLAVAAAFVGAGLVVRPIIARSSAHRAQVALGESA